MRNPGLEPGSLSALEPESSASANSASSACLFSLGAISDYELKIYFCQTPIAGNPGILIWSAFSRSSREELSHRQFKPAAKNTTSNKNPQG